jgi:hypothetical protein
MNEKPKGWNFMTPPTQSVAVSGHPDRCFVAIEHEGEKMHAYRNTFVALIGAVAIALMAGACSGALLGKGGQSGLAVRISQAEARNLGPSESMVVANYVITCTRASTETVISKTFEASSSGATFGTIYLEPGDWAVDVKAYNAGETPVILGDLIGGGSVPAETPVTVVAGDVSMIDIAVTPLPGEGFLDLTVDFSDSAVLMEILSLGVAPQILGRLEPENGDPDITFSVSIPSDATTLTYSSFTDVSDPTILAGYYRLYLSLSDGSAEQAWAAPESLRIVQGLTTAGTLWFTTTGSAIEMKITVDLLAPITFTIQPFSARLPQGNPMTVTAVPSTLPSDTVWEWYLDGIHGNDSLTFDKGAATVPATLGLGRHRLDLYASTPTRAGSTTLFFDVVAPGSPETPPQGSYLVTNQVALDALPVLTSISGNLELQGEITNLGKLSSLTAIGGNLILSEVYALESLTGLANLKTIGGDLTIANVYALSDLSGLAQLETVGGMITINNNPTLNYANVPSLASIGKGIKVYSNVVLYSLVFPGLTDSGLPKSPADTTSAMVEIYDNNLLENVDFGNVIDHLTAAVSIRSNGQAGKGLTLPFGSVKATSSWIWLDGNLIRTLDLSSLARSVSPDNTNTPVYIRITNNEFAAVEVQDGIDVPVPAILDLGAYATMGKFVNSTYYGSYGLEGIIIYGNKNLGSIDLSGLVSFAHRLQIGANPEYSANPLVTAVNGGNRDLKSIDLSNLVSMTDYTGYEYSYLDLIIVNNPALTTVNLAKLRTLAPNGYNSTDLIIEDNPSLTELPYMPVLASVAGSISIKRNGLKQLSSEYSAVEGTNDSGFRILASVSGGIAIEENQALVSADLGLAAPLVLPASGNQSIRIVDNDSLTSLDGFFGSYRGPTGIGPVLSYGIDQINDKSHSLVISGNAVLGSIEALATSRITSFYNLTITGNPSLSILHGLDGISEIGYDLTIESNSDTAFTALSLPALTKIANTGLISGNTSLQSVDMPRLVEVGNDLKFTGCPALSALDLSDLDYAANSLWIEGSVLMDLSSIDTDGYLGGGYFYFQNNHGGLTDSFVKAWLASRIVVIYPLDDSISGND